MRPPSVSLKKNLSSAFKWESYSADPTWSENALGSLSRTLLPELLNPGAGFQEFDHRDFAMAFKRVDKETLPPRRWALKGRYGDGKSTFILALRQPALIVDADGRVLSA